MCLGPSSSERRVQEADTTVQKIARDCREILVVSSISLAYRPYGLWASLRYLAQVDR